MTPATIHAGRAGGGRCGRGVMIGGEPPRISTCASDWHALECSAHDWWLRPLVERIAKIRERNEFVEDAPRCQKGHEHAE